MSNGSPSKPSKKGVEKLTNCNYQLDKQYSSNLNNCPQAYTEQSRKNLFFILYSLPKTLLFLLLSVVILTSCKDDQITWEYTIPDGYEGWLAIQYDCPGGTPLDRQGDVIRVEFGEDGLFCTTDSSFSWSGTEQAMNNSRDRVAVYPNPSGETGYGICCGQAYGRQFSYYGQQIELTLDLMWVGNMESGYPPLDTDAIREDAIEGQLVPADW